MSGAWDVAQADLRILRTGTANLASMAAGLQKAAGLAEPPSVTESSDEILSARLLVIPGVGTLEAAMEQLHQRCWEERIRTRLREGKPTLAVCLGMQMLAEGSEESPGVPGLGVVPGHARRFPGPLRVPQLGWNQVRPDPSCSLVSEGYAYYANSFRLTQVPEGWGAAWSDYGGPFVAALEKQALLACQFHPELSGPWGIELLRRWLERGCSWWRERTC